MIHNIIEEELSKIRINVINNEKNYNNDIDALSEKLKPIENNIKILSKIRRISSVQTYILCVIKLFGFGYYSFNLFYKKAN